MRKIKAKERANGMKYCTYCKPERISAIWRDHQRNLSCEKHKDKLTIYDNGYMTEADYQTWWRY